MPLRSDNEFVSTFHLCPLATFVTQLSGWHRGFFNPSYVWYWFKKLLKKADLPDIRFHDLRHSVATILLAAGVDLRVVSELLGHSSIAITADIYGHVLPEQQKAIIDKMDDLFGDTGS